MSRHLHSKFGHCFSCLHHLSPVRIQNQISMDGLVGAWTSERSNQIGPGNKYPSCFCSAGKGDWERANYWATEGMHENGVMRRDASWPSQITPRRTNRWTRAAIACLPA